MKTLSAHALAAWLCSVAVLLAIPAVAGARPSAHIGAGPPAPSAHGAPACATAPLNPAFVRYHKELAAGTLPRSYGGHGLGLTPGPIDFGYLRGDQLKGAVRSYPAQYDLRRLGKVSAVGDQYPYGTCWTFATFGSLESCLLPGQSLSFSEDNMALNHGFDLHPVLARQDLKYDQGGDCVKSTAYLARWSGPVYASEDAYGDHKTPPNLVVRKHVQDVLYLPPRDPDPAKVLDLNNIKWALTKYGGIYTDIYADDGMCKSQDSAAYNAANASYYYDGVMYPVDDCGTNHAVTIVGWDDTYSRSNFSTTPPGNGAFIVKNSWGTGWGDAGYFYVSYYDYWLGYDLNAVFYDAESTSNYSHIYQDDPLGLCTWAYFFGASPTGWFANVFTAQSGNPLTAVSFYSAMPNSTYQVYTGSSVNGSKTLRASGTLAVPGYHTVSLPTPVALSNGQPFVVFVKITTPGWNYPVAVEMPVNKYGFSYSSAANAARGQSYVSSSGLSSSWHDVTTDFTGFEKANVCLKAFTNLPTVRYEETSTKLTYNPAWTSVTDAGCSGGKMCTCSAAGLVVASFKGTGISVLATKGPAYGKIKVTLDGVVQPTVDLYAAAPAYQKKVFTTTGLTNAAHTLRLDWTNTKNGAASLTTVNLDALDVQGTLTALPTVRSQESSALLSYSPAWTSVTDAGCSGGKMRAWAAAGPVTATFDGTGIGVLATKGAAYGKLKVTLDGVVQPTVDLYAAAPAYQQKVFTKSGLAYAAHTLKLEWTNTKNGAASATTVNLDALDVTGTLTQAPVRYEETNTKLAYSPGWTSVTDASCSGGKMRTIDAAGSVTTAFTGTGIGVIATKGSAWGKLKVTLDGVVQPTVDLYAAGTKYQQKVFTKTGLKNAAHILKLEWTGAQNGAASATTVNLDALDVTGTLTQAPVPTNGPLVGKWIWYFGVILPYPETYEADEYTFRADGTYTQLRLSTYPLNLPHGLLIDTGNYTATATTISLTGRLEDWEPAADDNSGIAAYTGKALANVQYAYHFANNGTSVVITEGSEVKQYDKE